MFEYTLALVTTKGSVSALEGEITFDRNWSPWGQGRLVVPLDRWEQLNLKAFDRHIVTVDLDAIEDGIAASANWSFIIRRVQLDHIERTAMIELATWEALLQETVRQGTAWTPAGFADPADPDFRTLLEKVLDQLGSTLTVGGTTAAFPVEDLAPWEPGQSAWEYLERYRAMTELVYEIGITSGHAANFILREPVAVATDVVGSALLEHAETFMAEEYADAVTVVWKWTEAGVDYEQRDTAYASGVSDWRAARRHVEIERPWPPIAGYAQRIVNRSSRHRYLHNVSSGLQRFQVSDAAPYLYNWRSRTYVFDAVPTLRRSIIKEFS